MFLKPAWLPTCRAPRCIMACISDPTACPEQPLSPLFLSYLDALPHPSLVLSSGHSLLTSSSLTAPTSHCAFPVLSLFELFLFLWHYLLPSLQLLFWYLSKPRLHPSFILIFFIEVLGLLIWVDYPCLPGFPFGTLSANLYSYRLHTLFLLNSCSISGNSSSSFSGTFTLAALSCSVILLAS